MSAVLINTGVFENYYGHPMAFAWHVDGLGEAMMASTTRESFGLMLQSGSLRPLPQEYVDTAWRHYDPATRTAALKLYRSFATPDAPDKMGREQAAVLRKKQRPALVVWGASDPFIPVYVAYEQSDAFPGAQVELLAAGHWPFVEIPADVDGLVEPFWKQNAHVVLPPKPAKPKPKARAKKKSQKKRCARGRRAGPGRSARSCRRRR